MVLGVWDDGAFIIDWPEGTYEHEAWWGFDGRDFRMLCDRESAPGGGYEYRIDGSVVSEAEFESTGAMGDSSYTLKYYDQSWYPWNPDSGFWNSTNGPEALFGATDEVIARLRKAVADKTTPKDEKSASLPSDEEYTYQFDGFSFVLPKAWRGQVEVIEETDSWGVKLKLVVPGWRTISVFELYDVGSTVKDMGEDYDTESYYRRYVKEEVANKDGNKLLICKIQRREVDGCLVGPREKSAVLQPTLSSGWDSDTGRLVPDEERVRLVGLLIDGAEDMDVETLDTALIQYMADQIVFE